MKGRMVSPVNRRTRCWCYAHACAEGWHVVVDNSAEHMLRPRVRGRLVGPPTAPAKDAVTPTRARKAGGTLRGEAE